jgi:hypothetical protein
MIQKVCDACREPIPDRAEYVEVSLEGVDYKVEHFHDACVTVESLAEHLRAVLDNGGKRLKVDRRTW